MGAPKKYDNYTRATLSMDAAVIQAAKAKAKSEGVSISKLTNDFLAQWAALTPESPPSGGDSPLSKDTP